MILLPYQTTDLAIEYCGCCFCCWQCSSLYCHWFHFLYLLFLSLDSFCLLNCLMDYLIVLVHNTIPPYLYMVRSLRFCSFVALGVGLHLPNYSLFCFWLALEIDLLLSPPSCTLFLINAMALVL